MKRLRRAFVHGPRLKRAFVTLAPALAVLASTALASCGGRTMNPQKSEAQLAFGIQMAKRGLWSEALFRFQKAERMSPGNARILGNMAVAYEALGQFDMALDYYQRALKSSGADSDLRRNYSRFVEFYRNFRAETEGDEAEAAGEEDGATDEAS